MSLKVRTRQSPKKRGEGQVCGTCKWHARDGWADYEDLDPVGKCDNVNSRYSGVYTVFCDKCDYWEVEGNAKN